MRKAVRDESDEVEREGQAKSAALEGEVMRDVQDWCWPSLACPEPSSNSKGKSS